MLQHAVLSDEPIFQTQINTLVNNSPIKNELFNRNKELYRLMQSFGMNEYYNIPFQSCIGDAKALFSVTAKGVAPADFQRLVERHRPALHALGRAVDQVGSQKFGSHFQRVEHHANMIIHAKPLQLLNVLANRNMTLNDAAETLHISISTANQHIAAAKKALGANTTASAIIQAIKLGLIKLDK
jgi:DNA-binding NarL/FixJ family response regulator